MLGLREAEVISIDHTRPLMLGYIRRHLLMTDTELDDARERLGLFAEIEGFTLGTVYVEHLETTPAAFEALVEAVNRYEVTAVVVPSMLHFALLSAPAAIKDRFEHITGARVLVAAESLQVRRARRRAPD
jgi:hypothetical protein